MSIIQGSGKHKESGEIIYMGKKNRKELLKVVLIVAVSMVAVKWE